MQHSQDELAEVTDISRRAAALQADAMVRQLELEVEELLCRESTLAELAQSDDHLHCVKVGEDLTRPRQDSRPARVVSNAQTETHLLPTFLPDVPHPLRSSARQRLVQGVGELRPGNGEHLQVAGCPAGEVPGGPVDHRRNRWDGKNKTRGLFPKMKRSSIIKCSSLLGCSFPGFPASPRAPSPLRSEPSECKHTHSTSSTLPVNRAQHALLFCGINPIQSCFSAGMRRVQEYAGTKRRFVHTSRTRDH